MPRSLALRCQCRPHQLEGTRAPSHPGSPRMITTRAATTIALLGILLVATVTAAASESSLWEAIAVTPVIAASPAPAFNGQEVITGRTVSLAELRGRLVMLYF